MVFISRLLIFVLSIPAIYVAAPTALFLFVGMLPTLAALLVDRSKHKYKWLCVGGMNLTGASYYLFILWFDSHTIAKATELLTDVSTLLVMYLCASIGLVLYSVVPRFTVAFMHISAQRRVVGLKDKQKKLVEKWGEEIDDSDVAEGNFG